MSSSAGEKEVRDRAWQLGYRLYSGERLWGVSPDGSPAYCLMEDSRHAEDGCDMACHVVPGCWRVSLDEIRGALANVAAFAEYRLEGGADLAELEAGAHRDERKWNRPLIG